VAVGAAGDGGCRLELTVVGGAEAGLIAEAPQLRDALDRLGATLATPMPASCQVRIGAGPDEQFGDVVAG
jgi:hypothetical protein